MVNNLDIAPVISLRGLVALAALLIAGLSIPEQAPAHPLAAVLTGLVLDPDSLPLADAVIDLDGGQLITRSTPSGHYSIAAIPAGRHRLVVREIGFAPDSVELQIPGQGRVSRSFMLTPRPLELDVPPATGPPGQTR